MQIYKIEIMIIKEDLDAHTDRPNIKISNFLSLWTHI